MEKKEIIEQILAEWKAPEGQPLSESWESIQNKISAQGKKGKTVSLRSWIITGAAAAAAAAIFVIAPWSGNESVSIYADSVMKNAHALPDGSSVFLNGGSTVEFAPQEWEESRFVDLSGEAYFDVIKGSTFKVQTDQGVVEVLGTTFNVLNRGSEFEVECYTGKVGVSIEGEQVVILPGQGVELSTSGLKRYDLEIENPDWKLGEFKFENTDAKEVFKELEWQLGMEIILPELNGYEFTGEFQTKDPELALSTVCLALGLDHMINSDMTVTISKLD